MKKELAVIGTGLGGLIVGHTVGAMRGLCAGADVIIRERQKAERVQKILTAGIVTAVALAAGTMNENQKLREELMSK